MNQKAAKTKTAARKPFIVRGLNVTNEAFDSVGRLQDRTTFVEVIADTQAEAVVELTTNSTLHTMSARNLAMTQPSFGKPSDETKELVIIDLKLTTIQPSTRDMRQFRTDIREVLKAWAEKSRVVGRRGWRASALKTPTIEWDPGERAVVVRTQVILSTAVFYTDTKATVNVNFDYAGEMEDLQSLKRALVEHASANHWLHHFKFNHSEVGAGEVI